MRSVLRWGILILVLTLCATLGFSFLALKIGAARQDFKNFAEEKVSQFLKAHVRVGKIKIGLLNQIALTGLEIQPRRAVGSAYQLQVEQVIFSYQISQLFAQNFKSPATVILKSPKLVLSRKEFPYSFFDGLKFDRMAGLVPSLTLKEGETQIPVPGLPTPLIVSHINGSFVPGADGLIKADLHALLRGFVSVHMHIIGDIDLIHQAHHFSLEVESLSVGNQRFPKKVLHGKVRWENQNFYLEDLHSKINGWETEMKGSFTSIGNKPAFAAVWNLNRRDQKMSLEVRADLETSVLTGTVRLPKHVENFEGKIGYQNSSLTLDPLKFDLGYAGKVLLHLATGELMLDFERGPQKVAVKINFAPRHADIHLLLNHIQFGSLDCVSSSVFHITSLRLPTEDPNWKFQAAFETDYFILEYTPFDNLKGSFEITPRGIRNFASSWGDVFELRGVASWPSGHPEIETDLGIHGFDLRHMVQEFASKALPHRVAGILEGKLHIQGRLSQPEITGKFTVKDGKMGRLEYDRAMIQFRGVSPYFGLYDSRILKGRTPLYVTGGIDLTAQNVCRNVEIKTADNFVVVRGLEMVSDDGGFDLAPRLGKLSMLGVKSHSTGPEPSEESDHAPKDQFLGIGPKIKF